MTTPDTHTHHRPSRRGPHPAVKLLGLAALVAIVKHRRGHHHPCGTTATGEL